MASNPDQCPFSSPSNNEKVPESLSSSSNCSSTINQDGDCQSQLSVSTSSCEAGIHEHDPSSSQESLHPTNTGGKLISIKILRKPPNATVPIYSTHDCGPTCLDEGKRSTQIKGVITMDHCILINRVNPYCVPIFLGWHRAKVDGWIVYTAPCGKELNSLRQVYQYLVKTESKLSIDQFSFHSQLKLHSHRDLFRAHLYVADIANGKENLSIPCVNEIDSVSPVGSFQYINERIAGPNVKLEVDPEFLTNCVCQDRCKNCDECGCHSLSREEAYMIAGLDSVNQAGYKYKSLNKKLLSAVFECNSKCTCDSRCLNRVVQNGIKHCLQVFKTPNKGWGVRCMHDIPPGAFVCLYAGEIIDFDTVNDPDRISDYIAALDYIEEGRRPKRDFDTASDIDSLLDSDSSSSEELSSCEGISNSSIIDDLSDNSDNEADPKIIGEISTLNGEPSSSSIAVPSDNLDSNTNNHNSHSNGHPADSNDCTILLNDSSKRLIEDEIIVGVGKRAKKQDDIVPVIDLEDELISEALNSRDIDNEDVIIDFDSMDQSRISSSREGEHGTTIDYNTENNTINGDEIDEEEVVDPADPTSIPVIYKHLDMTYSFSIDGARFGNVGRFLNHSCEPNCRIRNIFVENHDYRFPRVAFFSTRLIKAYEELTWDYRYPPNIPYSESKDCLCGTRLCRGRIY